MNDLCRYRNGKSSNLKEDGRFFDKIFSECGGSLGVYRSFKQEGMGMGKTDGLGFKGVGDVQGGRRVMVQKE